MRKVVIVIAMALIEPGANGQQRFVWPRDRGDISPVGYLEKMEVGDVNRQLSEKGKHELCRLLVHATIVTARQYRDLYMLPAKASVYQLFKSNFPDVASRESPEEGISLTLLTKFIYSLPEYRADVEDLLKQSLERA